MKFRLVSGLGMTLLGLAVLGCGDSGPATGSVAGTVKYKGKPLPSGIVTFRGPEGRSGSSPISPEGTYTIANAPQGANKVTVDVPPAAGEDDGTTPGGPAPAPVPIPAHYGDAEKSGLTKEVKSGSQTFDIDLK